MVKQEPGDGTEVYLHQIRCFNHEIHDNRWQVLVHYLLDSVRNKVSQAR